MSQYRPQFMLGRLCKGFLSKLHRQGCLLFVRLWYCGLNVYPLTLCIVCSYQLLHCSAVNTCVVLPLLSSLFSTYHLPCLEQTDERVNLCVHITVRGVCVRVFFHLCRVVSRCCVCLLWHSQQSAFFRRSVITPWTTVRDSIMEGIKQQYMKQLHDTLLSPLYLLTHVCLVSQIYNRAAVLFEFS